ncbi:hypothetical protein JCM10908_007014 [Rhodotorula pacifica]|uniref:glycosyltransferase family 2 protein n=1 Tax=Rhodotorula pacifica TaxID=1495444 RepID=UPI00317A4F6D
MRSAVIAVVLITFPAHIFGSGFTASSSLLSKSSFATSTDTSADVDFVFEKLLKVPEEEVGRIAICASIRNEGRWLTEWILYHRAVGVDRFYLYDTGSDDDTVEILQPWIASGVVQLKRFRHDQGGNYQNSALDTCARTYGSETEWLLVGDVDEFYVATPSLTATKRRQPSRIREMPAEPLWKLLSENPLYDTADAVVISRVTYKNAGFDRLPEDASVMEQQTLRYAGVLSVKVPNDETALMAAALQRFFASRNRA